MVSTSSILRTHPVTHNGRIRNDIFHTGKFGMFYAIPFSEVAVAAEGLFE